MSARKRNCDWQPGNRCSRAQLGYAILTDDIVALSEHSGGFVVQPSYPSVRLWPESVVGLFGSPEALPLITPTWSKRFLHLGSARYKFQSEPLPLAAIYLLGERDNSPAAPFVEAVSARSALMALVADTYATHLLDAPRRAREFEVLGRLAGKLPLRQVRASSNIARISDQCRAIVDDFRQIGAPAFAAS
jgi:hypothetical protein